MFSLPHKPLHRRLQPNPSLNNTNNNTHNNTHNNNNNHHHHHSHRHNIQAPSSSSSSSSSSKTIILSRTKNPKTGKIQIQYAKEPDFMQLLDIDTRIDDKKHRILEKKRLSLKINEVRGIANACVLKKPKKKSKIKIKGSEICMIDTLIRTIIIIIIKILKCINNNNKENSKRHPEHTTTTTTTTTTTNSPSSRHDIIKRGQLNPEDREKNGNVHQPSLRALDKEFKKCLIQKRIHKKEISASKRRQLEETKLIKEFLAQQKLDKEEMKEEKEKKKKRKKKQNDEKKQNNDNDDDDDALDDGDLMDIDSDDSDALLQEAILKQTQPKYLKEDIPSIDFIIDPDYHKEFIKFNGFQIWKQIIQGNVKTKSRFTKQERILKKKKQEKWEVRKTALALIALKTKRSQVRAFDMRYPREQTENMYVEIKKGETVYKITDIETIVHGLKRFDEGEPKANTKRVKKIVSDMIKKRAKEVNSEKEFSDTKSGIFSGILAKKRLTEIQKAKEHNTNTKEHYVEDIVKIKVMERKKLIMERKKRAMEREKLEREKNVNKKNEAKISKVKNVFRFIFSNKTKEEYKRERTLFFQNQAANADIVKKRKIEIDDATQKRLLNALREKYLKSTEYLNSSEYKNSLRQRKWVEIIKFVMIAKQIRYKIYGKPSTHLLNYLYENHRTRLYMKKKIKHWVKKIRLKKGIHAMQVIVKALKNFVLKKRLIKRNAAVDLIISVCKTLTKSIAFKVKSVIKYKFKKSTQTIRRNFMQMRECRSARIKVLYKMWMQQRKLLRNELKFSEPATYNALKMDVRLPTLLVINALNKILKTKLRQFHNGEDIQDYYETVKNKIVLEFEPDYGQARALISGITHPLELRKYNKNAEKQEYLNTIRVKGTRPFFKLYSDKKLPNVIRKALIQLRKEYFFKKSDKAVGINTVETDMSEIRHKINTILADFRTEDTRVAIRKKLPDFYQERYFKNLTAEMQKKKPEKYRNKHFCDSLAHSLEEKEEVDTIIQRKIKGGF